MVSETDQDSASTTLAPVDPPIIQRIRTVSAYFTQSLQKNRGQSGKVGFMVNKLISDALDEAGEVPPEILEFYMGQATAVLYWAASGETIVNMPLPDDFDVPPVVMPHLAIAPPAVGEIES
jgi:hypothetical protein